MPPFAPSRRSALTAFACAAIAPSAWALASPSGKVILTISGELANSNDGADADFDAEMLQALPSSAFSTKTPWYTQPRRFEGVLLHDLLTAVGANAPHGLRAAALNDYRVDIPPEDLGPDGALLAWSVDGQALPVRDKGPLLVIYPFDQRPELREALHYSRAIWQLRRLDIP